MLNELLFLTNFEMFLDMDPSCIFIKNNKVICSATNLPNYKKSVWADWQVILKITAKFNQLGKCVCGSPLGSHSELHHCLLTKADTRGVAAKEQILHNTFNTIEIHHSCHELITRDKSFMFLKELYNEKDIKDWYNNVPMKVKPRKFWS